jgi:hypothetical protein
MPLSSPALRVWFDNTPLTSFHPSDNSYRNDAFDSGGYDQYQSGFAAPGAEQQKRVIEETQLHGDEENAHVSTLTTVNNLYSSAGSGVHRVG